MGGGRPLLEHRRLAVPPRGFEDDEAHLVTEGLEPAQQRLAGHRDDVTGVGWFGDRRGRLAGYGVAGPEPAPGAGDPPPRLPGHVETAGAADAFGTTIAPLSALETSARATDHARAAAARTAHAVA